MSERKVINKYYPPDFDPLKVKPKRKLNKNNNTSATTASSLQTVRLMTPFSMRCTSCGEYISKSKKFNAKKQDTNERYLQQKIFRFHIRCPRCNGEIVFRTDPKSTDFVMELGGERNYNPVKDKAQNKLESYDEILERLEREDILEREELADKEKIQKMTKIQELELKLIQQQDEEILNEELKNLIEKNAKNDGVVLKGGVGESIEDDQEFDRLAREEFEALKRELQLKEREQTKTGNGKGEKVTVGKQEPVKSRSVSGSVSGLVAGYDSSSDDDDENVNDSDEKIVKVIKIAAPKKRSFNFSSNNLSKKMKK